MSRNRTTRGGFTLIELTITVAIIGVLSATAISLFRAQQLRTKRSEAMTNLSAVAKMENGYFGENGVYLAATMAPPGLPGSKQNWQAVPPFSFDSLGFRAEGSVWFVYDVNSPAALCPCPSGTCFTASAIGDSDLDGNMAVLAYFHADGGGVVCPTQMFGIGPPIDPSDGLPMLGQPVDIFMWSGPIVDDY